MEREDRQLRSELQAQEAKVSALIDTIERLKTDLVGVSNRTSASEKKIAAGLSIASVPVVPNKSLTEGSGVPDYILLQGSVAIGDSALKGPTVWDTSKAIIKEIQVWTTNADWELWLVQNSAGKVADTAKVKAVQLMNHGNGNETIFVDRPYEDEQGNSRVYLYFQDAVGTASFSVSVVATELA